MFDKTCRKIAMEREAKFNKIKERRKSEINPLPLYLQFDIEQFEELENTSFWDCVWCELFSSINSAEREKAITPTQAKYLRRKYLKTDSDSLFDEKTPKTILTAQALAEKEIYNPPVNSDVQRAIVAANFAQVKLKLPPKAVPAFLIETDEVAWLEMCQRDFIEQRFALANVKKDSKYKKIVKYFVRCSINEMLSNKDSSLRKYFMDKLKERTLRAVAQNPDLSMDFVRGILISRDLLYKQREMSNGERWNVANANSHNFANMSKRGKECTHVNQNEEGSEKA